MDSDADSLFAPSTSCQSAPQAQSNTQRTSRKPRSLISSVWAHCRPARDDDEDSDPKLKYCTLCTAPPIYASNISSNMRKHLEKKHSIDVEISVGQIQATALQQLDQLYGRAKLSGQTSEIDDQVFLAQLDQNTINEALISLIVVRNLPFRMVEWPEFHTFCQVLNPKSVRFITTAHSQIGRKIKEAWQTHKDTVRKKLQSALSSIHLSVDIWTSPNRLLLLAVTADFVGYAEERHMKALLALRIVKGHSGKEQFDVLLPVLQDYGIMHKLGAVVADNSGTNNTLCQEIEDHLL
jgi:hypothetical protein